MSQIELVGSEKGGINWCVNCVGIHPDAAPDIMDYVRKMKDPGKDAMHQWQTYEKKLYLYKNKSCAMCGRTYDKNGRLDETFELTAKRVKEEFDHAGVFGVADSDIQLVVADCRKAFIYLLANRPNIQPQYWERFTFQGRLLTIICKAQDARASKNGVKLDFGKGLKAT